MRIAKGKKITPADRAELRMFEKFLARRAALPDENVFLAHAEVYGEVVFEDSPPSSEAVPSTGQKAKRPSP